MTAIKIDSKAAANAAEALARHAAPLFATLGGRRLAVVELRSVERAEPAENEDKERSVKVRIDALEVASPEQEEALREVLQALYVHRTAYGTLTEDGDIELSERTIEHAGGKVSVIEAARLHAAIDRWTDYGRNALSSLKMTNADLRREFDTVIKGLRAIVNPQLDEPKPKKRASDPK